MARAQGSLEYMVIIAVILAISSIVIVYTTGIIGGQKTSVSISSCKQASIDCKLSKMGSPTDPCTACDTSCKTSAGVELFDGATYCCNHALPDMVFEDSGGCGGGYSTTTCYDGTVKMTCSSTKPKFCDANLNLINDCSTCDCPTGYACNPTSKACYLACSDGTPINTCSAVTANTYCTSSGSLVPDCQQCPSCPSGQTCSPTTKTCYPSCSDGTPYNTCTANKPVYCGSGTLINSCGLPGNCGCPPNKACNVSDNSCYTPLKMVELFYDEFTTLNAWTGGIAPDAWHINNTLPFNLTSSVYKDNYSGEYITHTQSTASATKINVSFWVKNMLRDTVGGPGGFASEIMRLEWFDGTTWTSMDTLPYSGVWTYYSYNLPASAENNANFAIRFLCGDSHEYDNDACWVDTVRIRALLPGCSDGTLLGQCSATKPKYCDLGNLVNKCGTCDCPPDSGSSSCCCDGWTGVGQCYTHYSCGGSGSCSSESVEESCSPCASGCCATSPVRCKSCGSPI